MLFSDVFNIGIDGSENWFDPILSVDTKLFVDPFLIYQTEFGPFIGAHREIIDFYAFSFQLVSISAGRRGHPSWQKALAILKTPEVEELCLGFTSQGTDGGGAGLGKARYLAEGMERAIASGLANPSHFETIQLFREGIAQDTISDAVGNVLRMRFAEYTKQICLEFGVPTQDRPHLRAKFDHSTGQWIRGVVTAPINPYNGKQILLCPKDYLRPLPTLNPKDYWGYCFDQSADELRQKFGEDISRLRTH